ncbi:MAG: GyrI-like domain-containing protein [Betaproteobacteria bacterium]|nr:GyrI-like domain-containing protein [Betaproteobacteria bacterium]
MPYKRYLPFLFAFVLPIVLVYAWWGGFNAVDIRTETRGPYTYAYIEYTGDYAKLPSKLEEVRRQLKAQGIEPGLPITVLYSDPAVVAKSERRARIGCLVPPGTAVKAPMRIDAISSRPVLVAEVRAGMLIAPSRAYQALGNHLAEQDKAIRMPTVELYAASDSVLEMGVLTVEMEAP